jgi:hypothetical protein
VVDVREAHSIVELPLVHPKFDIPGMPEDAAKVTRLSVE